MLDGLHAVMLAGAGVNACCSLGSRHSRSAVTITSTVVMGAAMLDTSLGLFGVAPLVWTVLLLAWGMVSAAALRHRRGAVPPPVAAGGILHVHHLLGLIVTAGQLAVHGGMGAGAGGHAHSVSVLLLVAAAGGVLFTGWSLVLVAAARTGLERGTLMGMSLMTVAMGLMPFA